MHACAHRLRVFGIAISLVGLCATVAMARQPPEVLIPRPVPEPGTKGPAGPPVPLKMLVTPAFRATTDVDPALLREIVDEITNGVFRDGRSFVLAVNEADADVVLEVTDGHTVAGRGSLTAQYKIDAQVRILDLYDGAVGFTIPPPGAPAAGVGARPAPQFQRPPGRWAQGAAGILTELSEFCAKNAAEIDKRRRDLAEYNARDIGVDVATVVVRSADLRQKADAASPLVKTLERGTEAVVITRTKTSGWLNVVLPETLDEGWIRDDAVRLKFTERPRETLFQPAKSETPTAPPVLKVFNDTDREITLSIAGTRHTIPSQARQNITVQPGTFTVFCSAARALPYTGTETWENGFEYSVRYYIDKK